MKTSIGKSFALLILFALLLTCSPSQRGVIVLCAGDSLTESPYPRFLKNIFTTAGIRTKVLNFGRSGNTTGEYLSFLLNNKDSLAEKHPDFVCLLLGTNDVRNDHDNTSLFLKEFDLLLDVHPTEEGYRRLAQNWFEALRPLIK